MTTSKTGPLELEAEVVLVVMVSPRELVEPVSQMEPAAPGHPLQRA
jgi:hypothetical protein